MNFEKIMSIVREYLQKPLVTLIVGIVIGLIIGLPILGWGVFPVKWEDAAPSHLRDDIKEEYMRMMIESFAYNHDSYLALSRWQELGDGANEILAAVQADPNLVPDDVASFSMLVGVPYTPTFITEEPMGEEEAPEDAVLPSDVTAEGDEEKGKISPLLLLGILCALLLIVGGALAYILVIRKRPNSLLSSTKQAHEADTYISEEAYYDEGDDSPLAQYMTTYMLGDDLYDDSFSIDSPTGEFLGECGVGISETIGVGDPKKVAAFEVWLFDKNDIQTVTKVLMSDHAFNDPTISQRLVSKGEPVVIEPGKVIMLETATLQLEARVVDLDYGKGALPDNSFFDRLTLELAVWPKGA
jgi:hypothetical protein